MPQQPHQNIDSLLDTLFKTPPPLRLNCLHGVQVPPQAQILILDLLPEDARLPWITTQKFNAEHVLDILVLLPLNCRVNFLTTHPDLIPSGYALSYLIHELPIEQRLSFSEQHQDKILNGIELLGVLHELNPKDQIDFLYQQVHKIQNSTELSWILDLLSQQQIMDFIAQHPQFIRDTQDTQLLLEKLNKQQRIHFAQTHPFIIRNASCLALILKALPESQRLEFSFQHLDKIHDPDDLNWVLHTLDAHDRLQFVKTQKIQNEAMLFQIIRSLSPSQRFAFLLEHQAQLQQPQTVSRILSIIPQAQPDNNHLSNHANLLSILKILLRQSPYQELFFACIPYIQQLHLTPSHSFAELIPYLLKSQYQSQTLAFLSDYLNQQLQQKNWTAYWDCCRFIPNYHSQSEQLLQNPELLNSLQEEAHARIFLQLNTAQHLKKIMPQIIQHDPQLAMNLITVFRKLQPHASQWQPYTHTQQLGIFATSTEPPQTNTKKFKHR